MYRHNTLAQGTQRKIQICQAIIEKDHSSRKRIRQFRQRPFVGRGRGRGRGGMRSRDYNPYSMIRNFRENFKPEARIYSNDEYNNLTPSQKSQIHELKLKNGWLDGCTPPPGFQITSHTGRIKPNTQLVSIIRTATFSTSYDNQAHNQIKVGFTSHPHVIGESINGISGDSSSSQLGSSFGRSGRRRPSYSNLTISLVTVNGRSYHGPIFDEKGNQPNWLLIH